MVLDRETPVAGRCIPVGKPGTSSSVPFVFKIKPWASGTLRAEPLLAVALPIQDVIVSSVPREIGKMCILDDISALQPWESNLIMPIRGLPCKNSIMFLLIAKSRRSPSVSGWEGSPTRTLEA